MCAVKLKAGPFSFHKLKSGPFVFCFFAFYFQKSHSPCRKKRHFEKQAKINEKHFYKLKTGPIMVRNILGPVFNLHLDQFLTLIYIYIYFFFVFAEIPIFIAFSAKMQNFKEPQKRKNTLFVNTTVLTALVKRSVLFLLHFSFLLFLQFPFFQRCCFDRFPKIKR